MLPVVFFQIVISGSKFAQGSLSDFFTCVTLFDNCFLDITSPVDIKVRGYSYDLAICKSFETGFLDSILEVEDFIVTDVDSMVFVGNWVEYGNINMLPNLQILCYCVLVHSFRCDPPEPLWVVHLIQLLRVNNLLLVKIHISSRHEIILPMFLVIIFGLICGLVKGLVLLPPRWFCGCDLKRWLLVFVYLVG